MLVSKANGIYEGSVSKNRDDIRWSAY